MSDSRKPPEREDPAPGFAMKRAVDILASIYEKNRAKRNVPPAPLDRPVVLANERLVFALGTTAREDVERVFGVGFAYPIRGWHTYAARENGARHFLSLFYASTAGAEPGRRTLVALEHYVPKADGAPGLAARDYGLFRLSPGDVALGAATATLDERYSTAVGGPAPVVYAEAYEARFPGGVAYVMGNAGQVERIGLYAAT
ncbi:MAG: hypothetical protein QOD51_2750 [Candidatus Eremiobacteraeota bacterium]|jgi:hypothetical protein|nr:hypothetical protein [Candidatus Eremiobacteraeota bacterium]